MCQSLSGFVFQETGTRHALEDRFACDWQAGTIAVADGVTRPEYDAGASAESQRVGTIATEFCRGALQHLSAKDPNPMADRMREIGRMVNHRIAALNRSFGFACDDDYLFRDPYACVGTCGALDDQGLWHFGYIGDCGMMLFSREGKRTNLTQNQLLGTLRLLDSLPNLNRTEELRLVRSRLRNRADARNPDGQPCGYGVLNGDARAEPWWTTGAVLVHDGDVVVAYSDGAEQLIELAEFAVILDVFRENGQAREAESACRELWQRQLSRAGSRMDDATIAAADVTASR
jgi:hypothetical protein